MVESLSFLILLVFLVLAVIFDCTDTCKLCLVTHIEKWFPDFGGIVKIFFIFFVKRGRWSCELVLLSFNSFCLVVIVVTLLVKSSAVILILVTNSHVAFYTGYFVLWGKLTWLRMTINLVHVWCMYLLMLVFRSSSIKQCLRLILLLENTSLHFWFLTSWT